MFPKWPSVCMERFWRFSIPFSHFFSNFFWSINKEIRVFTGHEVFATTEKYYEFPTNSMDKKADAYEKALSYTKKM